MIIKRIDLQNFRNYQKRTFEFSEGVNLVVGDNAVGKTNLLEAIYLLASGKSFRVKSVEREMIGYGEEIARVSATILVQSSKFKVQSQSSKLETEDEFTDSKTELEIVLTTGEVGGEKAGKKKYLVDGVAKRAFDFLGNFRAVCFGPEDLELVTDSPSLRRKYLDSVLVQVDREYARCLLAYEKGIRARNKLLETIREEGGEGFIRRPPADRPPSQSYGGTAGETPLVPGYEGYRRRLYFWDQLVIKNGNVLTKKRQEYIDFLNNTKTLILRSNRVSSENNMGDEIQFRVEYDWSLISEERLKQYEREEVASAMTLVGPHRDDFVVKIKNQKSKIKNIEGNNYIDSRLRGNDSGDGNDSGKDLSVYGSRGEPFDSAQGKLVESRDLSIYGSRGEQRLAILWLKLGELAYIEKETGDRPVLLLDDIFSELDEEHRELVLGLVGKQQTIITTADRGILGDLSSKFPEVNLLDKGGLGNFGDIKVIEIGVIG